MDDEEWWNQVNKISFDYIHSESFRDSVNTFLRDNRLGITFMEERDGLALFPKITTHKMTEILKELSRDELVSREGSRSEEHTSDLQSRGQLVCRLLLDKKKQNIVIISQVIVK